MNIRQKALEALPWRLAHENIGIYPMAVTGGPNPYEKRTEKMEGWNECAIEHSSLACDIAKWLKDLPAEHKEKIEDLLLEDVIGVRIIEKAVTMDVNCNDLFYWGCADSEEMELAELANFTKAIDDAIAAGDNAGHGALLWVARKRGERPQGAYYKCFSDGLKKLMNECGPERETGFGNPVSHEATA